MSKFIEFSFSSFPLFSKTLKNFALIHYQPIRTISVNNRILAHSLVGYYSNDTVYSKMESKLVTKQPSITYIEVHRPDSSESFPRNIAISRTLHRMFQKIYCYNLSISHVNVCYLISLRDYPSYSEISRNSLLLKPSFLPSSQKENKKFAIIKLKR